MEPKDAAQKHPHRIRWSPAEWKKVVARAKLLWQQVPDVPLAFLFDEASRLSLPKDRLRPRVSLGQSLDIALRYWGPGAPSPRRGGKWPKAVAARPPEPKMMGIKTLKAALDFIAPPTAEHPMPVVRPYTVEEHFTAAITGLARPFFEAAGGLVDRLELLGERLDGIDRALAAFQSRIERTAGLPVLQAVPEAKPPKERRPRIVVVGLLPGQAHVVREDLVALGVDLVFVDKEKSPAFDVGASDGAVVYTRFVGHRHEEKLRSLLGRDRVLLTSGGLGSLRTAVAQMAARINGAA